MDDKVGKRKGFNSCVLKMAYAVAPLVEVLCYSWKVAGSNPDGVIGIFFDIILPATLCSWG